VLASEVFYFFHLDGDFLKNKVPFRIHGAVS
jgi:hypothetical protein